MFRKIIGCLVIMFIAFAFLGVTNINAEFSDMTEISEISDGITVHSVMGAHTANPITGDFSVEARNAFEIKNGEITNPIKKAMISGNIFEIMKKVEGLNSEIKQYGSFVMPKLLAHDLRVVGQN
jgi:PmbA protein